MRSSDLLALVRDVTTWLYEEYPTLELPSAATPQHPMPLPSVPTSRAVAPQKEAPSVPVNHRDAVAIAQHPIPPTLDFPELRTWANQYFKVCEPLTPIVCFGKHPLLDKLVEALNQQIAPASCVTALPPLDHPLLKALLVPLPVIIKTPILTRHCPHPVPHHFISPLLPLHPLEVYLNDPQEKRHLWNVLQKLPLFSSN